MQVAININTFPVLIFPSPLLANSTHDLQSTVAGGDLSILCLNATKSLSLAVGELVHGCLGKVEAIAGVVNSKNVHGLAIVCDTVAGTALSHDVRDIRG